MISTTWTLLVAFAVGADPCTSGVPVGGKPGPYSFLVATGPQLGQPTCYICEQAAKPSIVIFTRTLSEPLGKLLGKLDVESLARKDSGLKVWMTQLTATADLDALAKWSQTVGLKTVAIGAFEDADGPPAYKLANDADVTVMLFVNQKVIANFAFRNGELTESAVADVLKAVPGLFPKK